MKPRVHAIVPILLLAHAPGCGGTRDVQRPTDVETPGTTEVAAPVVTTDLSGPWTVAHRDEEAITLKLGEGPDGARVQLVTGADGRQPGVAPIHGGRTMEVATGDAIWPMAAVARPDHPVTAVHLTVEGVDLVARMDGPPLSAILPTADAPDDPVITWVRIRRRPGDWMVAWKGLGILSLPAEDLKSARRDDVLALDTTWGEVTVETDAVRVDSETRQGRFAWTDVDSMLAYEPYAETVIRWTPTDSISP